METKWVNFHFVCREGFRTVNKTLIQDFLKQQTIITVYFYIIKRVQLYRINILQKNNWKIFTVAGNQKKPN